MYGYAKRPRARAANRLSPRTPQLAKRSQFLLLLWDSRLGRSEFIDENGGGPGVRLRTAAKAGAATEQTETCTVAHSDGRNEAIFSCLVVCLLAGPLTAVLCSGSVAAPEKFSRKVKGKSLATRRAKTSIRKFRSFPSGGADDGNDAASLAGRSPLLHQNGHWHAC